MSNASRRSIHRRHALAIAAAAVLGPLSATPAAAAVCTWDTTSGNWSAITNWLGCVTGNGNPVQTPGSNDTANIGATGVVTIDSAQAVQSLNNAGQINLDAFTLTLAGGGTVNSGTINVGSATAAALQVNAGHNINNAGGVINVANGSVLNQFGSTISGGTINTTGTGALMAFSSGNNVLDNVKLNGLLDVQTNANARERIANGLTLDGSANVGNGGILSFDSSLTSGGSQTIAGNAIFNLNDAGARLSIEGGGSTTLASTVVVRGQGNIGQANYVGGNNVLTNNGRISADVAGGTLVLTPPGNAGSVVNNGVLDARGGGTLAISTNVDNSGGLINAQNASNVVLGGITIKGGTLGTSGSGVIQAASSGNNFLDGTKITGTLDMTGIANSRARLINTSTLNGAINVANGGILSLDSSQSAGNAVALNGTGVINLNDAGARLSIEGGGTSVLGVGTTVRGQGNIGQALYVGGNNVLTSNGLISADVAGGTLNIVAPGNAGSFVNNGTLQAINGATLLLSTNIQNNAGSQIVAGAGSQVVQNGVTLNGVINVSGGGVLTTVSSGNNVLNAVTLTGALDVQTIANGRERIANGLTLDGGVNVGNGGILAFDSSLTSGGSQTIAGNATFNLNDAGARLSIEGAGSTTLASTVVVRGQGNIGTAAYVGGNNTLTNNGLVSADVNGKTLELTAPGNAGSFVNNGTLQAIDGATLLLSTNIQNNAGSEIIAGAGSQVVQNGVTLNGVINVSGGGVLTAVSSGNNVLDNVALTGVFDVQAIANARERIANGLTLDGSANVGNGGILSFDSSLTSGGSQTIAGNAIFNLNDAGARLSIEGGGSTTLASTVVVRGQGNIGQANYVGGNNVLTNNGRISADVAGGTLVLTPPGNAGSVVNNGVLDARGGGTLAISTNVDNSGGLINAQNASNVVLGGITIKGGTLGTSGSGVIQAASSGNNFLDGTKITGTLDMTGIANSRARLINTSTLNGAINVANGGILSLDSSQSAGNAVALNGTGVINLNDAGARLSIEGGGTSVLGAGTTVRGQGNIGQANYVGGNNTLTNNGLILADVAGGTLAINAPANAGSVVNNGTLRAQDGTLTVNSALVNHGMLRADAAGVMNLPTNFANDGLMTGVGKFALSGTLANNGHMRPGTPGGAPGALTLAGNYAQGAAGWFDVGLDGASFGSLAVGGSAALDGMIGVICGGTCNYAVGTSWIVMTTGGTNLVSGTFAGPVAMSGFSSGAFAVTYLPNQVVLNVTEATVGVVPEPGTVALMLAGLAVVGFVARRRVGA